MELKHNPDLTDRAKFLRKNMTQEEKRLWYDYLRLYPVRFLRQKVIDTFIVDFYCARARLVIEIDGSHHHEGSVAAYDMNRTDCLERRQLQVLRIPNDEIRNAFHSVCLRIDQLVKECLMTGIN